MSEPTVVVSERARMRAADKARHAYVRRLYRADPTDPALYHLVIDSTAIPLDTVVELILLAARAQAAGTADDPVTRACSPPRTFANRTFAHMPPGRTFASISLLVRGRLA